MGKIQQSFSALRNIWTGNTGDHSLQELKNRLVRSTHYDAAFTNRLRGDWSTSSSIPYSDIKSSLSNLIARSRREISNNGIASGILNTIINNVWGDGPTIQAQVKDKSGNLEKTVNNKLEDAWKRHSDEMDATGQFNFNLFGKLGLETAISSGTFLINRVPSKRDQFLQLTYQMLEPDVLDSGMDLQKIDQEMNKRAKQVLHGIAIDENYFPIAYYIKGLEKPISSKNMRHFYLRKRPAQVVGVPWLSASLDDLFDYRQLKEDTIVKSRILADIALWLEQGSDPFSNSDNVNSGGNLEWEPGSFLRTKSKPEVIQAEGDLNAVLKPLLNRVLLDACSGIGISYMAVSRDMDGVNFAASRTNLNEDRSNYKSIRTWLINTFCQYVWNNFVLQCVIENKVDVSPSTFIKDPYKYTRVSFQFPSWDWVDPRADTDAIVNMRTSGLSNLADICAKRGQDWRDFIDQSAEEFLYIKEIAESKEIDPIEFMGTLQGKNGGNNGKKEEPATAEG